jgi:hypothetical protein
MRIRKMTEPDLSLIPLQDLIDELFDRCDDAVIGIRKNTNEGTRFYKRHWTGDPMVCLGLCDAVKASIVVDFEEILEDCEDV